MAFAPARRSWLVFVLALCGLAQAAAWGIMDVTQTTWNVGTFGAAQLSGPPGSDFTSTQTSASDYLNLSVTWAFRGDNTDWSWRVDVGKTDTLWDSDMTLWIRRTAAGTGTGTITGGTVYQQITDTAASFCTGTRNRRNFKAQLELRGLSVTVGEGAYSTTVTYTMTEQ